MITKQKLAHLAVPMLAALAFPMFVVAGSAGASTASKPSTRATAKRAAAPAAVPKSPLTISFTSNMRQGNLVVLLDGMPVFNEEFRKPALLISQTTTWDPLPVRAGKHKLTAKVYGANGKTYLSEAYDLEISRTKGTELRIRTKGAGVTVEPAS